MKGSPAGEDADGGYAYCPEATAAIKRELIKGRGVVNPGESYVSFEENRWLDWRTVLDSVSGEGSRACMAYDNLPLKGYVYSLDEIMAIHDLDTRIPAAGGEAAICPDCGFVLEIPEL